MGEDVTWTYVPSPETHDDLSLVAPLEGSTTVESVLYASYEALLALCTDLDRRGVSLKSPEAFLALHAYHAEHPWMGPLPTPQEVATYERAEAKRARRRERNRRVAQAGQEAP